MDKLSGYISILSFFLSYTISNKSSYYVHFHSEYFKNVMSVKFVSIDICVLCNLCNFHQSVWETESSVPMRLVKTVLLMLSTPFFFNVGDV